MDARLQHILEKWFLSEPALFLTACTHRLVENADLKVPFRTGDGRIEYCPDFVQMADEPMLMECLMAEVVRILLKHPYERQPDGCTRQQLTLGSNLVLGDNCRFTLLDMPKPAEWDLPEHQSYEWYCHHLPVDKHFDGLLKISFGKGGDGEQPSEGDLLEETSSLWKEDVEMQNAVEIQVEKIAQEGSWGSLPMNLVEHIVQQSTAKVDYRKVLMGFRSSVISATKVLTRMRPNRRLYFDYLGSRHDLKANILIAMDTSRSIRKEMLVHFLTVVDRIFKYGVERVDVAFFDTRVVQVLTLDRAQREMNVSGRGGTDFQEVLNYAHQNRYDGLVILTDGEAAVPVKPAGMRCKLVWVFTGKDTYRKHQPKLGHLGRCCYIEF